MSAVMNGYDANAIRKTYLGTTKDMIDVPLLDIGGMPIFELREQFAAMGVELQNPVLKVFNDVKAPEDAPPYPFGARNDRVEVWGVMWVLYTLSLLWGPGDSSWDTFWGPGDPLRYIPCFHRAFDIISLDLCLDLCTANNSVNTNTYQHKYPITGV